MKSYLSSHLILDKDEKIDKIDFSKKYKQWEKELEQKRIQILKNLNMIISKHNPEKCPEGNKIQNKEFRRKSTPQNCQNQVKLNKKHRKKAILLTGTLKKEKSLLRKLETEYPIKTKKANNKEIKYKDFNDIKDFLRFTIILIDPLSQMPEIVSKLQALYNVPIKDKNSFNNPSESGYADRNLVFSYKADIYDLDNDEKDGKFSIKFEVQFQLCSFFIGKKVGHVFYEVVRILDLLKQLGENGKKKFENPSDLFKSIKDEDGQKFYDLFGSIEKKFVSLDILHLREFRNRFRIKGSDGFVIDDEFVRENSGKTVEKILMISNWIYKKCSRVGYDKQIACINNSVYEVNEFCFIEDKANFSEFCYNYIRMMIVAERILMKNKKSLYFYSYLGEYKSDMLKRSHELLFDFN